jgi:hypothetical protein
MVIVEVDELMDDVLQMLLTEEDDVIETFLPKDAIESFDKGVGVGSLIGGGDSSNAEQSKPDIELTASARKLAPSRPKLAKDAVIVMDQVAVRMVKCADLTQLIFDPRDGFGVTAARKTLRDPRCMTTKT